MSALTRSRGGAPAALRFLALGACLVLGLVACGGEALPASAPVVAIPPHDYLRDCGCDAAHCERLADGTGRCGAICGEACAQLCGAGSCVSGTGAWASAYCVDAGSALAWSQEPDCDDGDACTTGDVCAAGSCGGTRASNVVHRYKDDAHATWSWLPQTGFVDQGPMFREAPAGAGGRVQVHQMLFQTTLSRLLTTRVGDWTGICTTGNTDCYQLDAAVADPVFHAFSSARPGALRLQRYKFTCANDNCGTNHNGHTHYLSLLPTQNVPANASACDFTACDNPGASTTPDHELWVCPP